MKLTVEEAVKAAENCDLAGYSDWHLPTDQAAIDKIFNATPIYAIDGRKNYPNYWTSTTHLDGPIFGTQAIYIVFGEARGFMNNTFLAVHGACRGAAH